MRSTARSRCSTEAARLVDSSLEGRCSVPSFLVETGHVRNRVDRDQICRLLHGSIFDRLSQYPAVSPIYKDHSVVYAVRVTGLEHDARLRGKVG